MKNYEKIKYYFVIAEIGEGYPDYEFILKAETLKEAEKKAFKIIKNDYPDNWEYIQRTIFVEEFENKERLIERVYCRLLLD